MPDISMCRNLRCPLRANCYRYTAKPDEFWQSYASFQFDPNGTCEGFVSNE